MEGAATATTLTQSSQGERSFAEEEQATAAALTQRTRRRTGKGGRNGRDVFAMGTLEEEVTAECGEHGGDRWSGWGRFGVHLPCLSGWPGVFGVP